MQFYVPFSTIISHNSKLANPSQYSLWRLAWYCGKVHQLGVGTNLWTAELQNTVPLGTGDTYPLQGMKPFPVYLMVLPTCCLRGVKVTTLSVGKREI